MTWCSNDNPDDIVDGGTTSSTDQLQRRGSPPSKPQQMVNEINKPQQAGIGTNNIRTKTCPSCGFKIQITQEQGGGGGHGIHDLPGLPSGVKFDPTDSELLEHLEGKVVISSRSDTSNIIQNKQQLHHHHHPLIDEFIPTLEGENGICYTHPEKLPGVSKDGLIRHFFHRPSKAYTTGTRKRRKVHTEADGGETRWHKTGKTRPVFVGGKLKGHKKILVLYTNYGKKRKPEKTNWVMHQYHLGNNEEEKDGELVVSKVFYQTQPRQCSSGVNNKDSSILTAANKSKVVRHGYEGHHNNSTLKEAAGNFVEYYNPSVIPYDQSGHNRASPSHLIPNFVLQTGGSSFLP